ncbi:hypothetical protein [Stenotrophomonas maltophilia]|uniref:hypothetical protein n=2 Tax=Stenotrophomonas maltophilia TaxID=40324 RepID=UPI000A7F170B|nr:hypothetical protein [Stenotrophomonas maltophilia]MBH1677052.1 hypothetical protein [Stenotrophomonas maltophilia]MDZ5778274.1 hypothetical protein [Stenotrophomonas maltophilia]HDS1624243.1 hypothetical protein [Stenotrophomonas maltophilia]HEL3198505.1 hypothetical protein [Stenotrophomonas maltophilia]HEL3212591.1 hypothetical protein [Stenotrophomonas maltophilia]
MKRLSAFSCGAFLFVCGADAEAARAFVVEDAAMRDPSCLTVEPRQRLFACHQIVAGNSRVIGLRRFRSSWWTDRSTFSKLTIQLPADAKAGDRFAVSDDRVWLFHSSGSSAFAGKTGCYAVPIAGQIIVVSAGDSGIELQVDATLRSASPLQWRDQCDAPIQLSERLKASPLQMQDLDAWTGAHESDASPFDQAHPANRSRD